jgi:hypothetical protein
MTSDSSILFRAVRTARGCVDDATLDRASAEEGTSSFGEPSDRRIAAMEEVSFGSVDMNSSSDDEQASARVSAMRLTVEGCTFVAEDGTTRFVPRPMGELLQAVRDACPDDMRLHSEAVVANVVLS